MTSDPIFAIMVVQDVEKRDLMVGDLVRWICQPLHLIENDIGIVVKATKLDVYIIWQRDQQASGWHDKDGGCLELVEDERN